VDLTTLPWLRVDSNQNTNFNDDMSLQGHYGFGQYRGHDRIIYWREDLQ
jgi:MSHA biogenesis protein MshQ